MTIKKNNKVNIPSGQNVLREVRGDLGQRINGPTHSATKVYVRRKEVMESSGKAQHLKGPAVDLNSVSKTDLLSSLQGDPIEKQCALVKEMGLTYGEDSKKVKGLMLDMDNRDNKVAAEMGIKKHQT